MNRAKFNLRLCRPLLVERMRPSVAGRRLPASPWSNG